MSENNLATEYLKVVWTNIQHNENIRNRLFQFYLVIAGSFLVFFKDVEGISDETAFLASVFVWIVGFSFLWAYERIKEMINRDNRIVTCINEILKTGNGQEKMIYKEYNSYKETVATTSLKWWSLSSCIVYSTSLISSLALAIGISHITASLPWYWLIAVTVVIFLTNEMFIMLMNNRAGIGKKNAT